MKKAVVIFIWLLLSATTALAAVTADETTSIKMLLSQLDKTGHDSSRLKILYRLTGITRNNHHENLRYTEMLQKEAEAQHNEEYLCYAYLARMVTAYNSYDIETINKYATLMEPIARKNKLYETLFKGKRCVIEMLTFSKDYEKSEREAKKMLQEANDINNDSGTIQAYQCLAMVYSMTFRNAQATEVLKKAYSMSIRSQDYTSASNIMDTLIRIYAHVKDTQNQLRSIKAYEELTKNIEAEHLKDKSFTNSSFLLIYIYYADYYMTTENNQQVGYYLSVAEQYYTEEMSPVYRCNYHLIKIKYYNNTEQYEKTIQEQDKVLLLLRNLGAESIGLDYYRILAEKTDVLYKMKRYDEALALHKQIMAYKDSSQITTINKQHDQLRHDFKEEQLLLENAQIKQRLLVYTILLLGLAILAILYLTAHAYRSSKILKKAEQEIHGAACEVEAANVAKDRFLSNINTAIREPLNNVVDGSMRLATDNEMTKDQSKALSEEIQSTSASLMKLINDILDLSRLEAGMMKFVYADNELLTIICAAAGAARAETGKDTEMNLPENELYMLNIDGSRLTQIFQSIFSKVSKKENISVTVGYEDAIVKINITGSALAVIEPSQDIIIRNEINRMLLEQFGGSYRIDHHTDHPFIEITIKPTEIIKMD